MTEKKTSYEGMSDEESVTHQVKLWAEGNPTHNPIRDECCPDFSCCNEGCLMPEEARTALLQAHLRGDRETVFSICMMGLSGLISGSGLSVHIAGEDTDVH